jgi:hypothetical protein
MTDGTWPTVLQKLLRRQERSLLQFIHEAYPWARPGEEKLVLELKQLIQEEQEAAAKLANFLRRHRQMLPYLGPFPMSYASLMFVSLDYLLPQLVEHERQELAQIGRDLHEVHEAEARHQIQEILDLKQRHLKKLEDLAAAAAKPAHA